ncbi:hypothetical protein, partial [Longimicrobium sp.]|uniref:hypothetical protein n=1 Tax=Longimicrobium sp. TaxID=2029185 RepID=UPI002E35E0EC
RTRTPDGHRLTPAAADLYYSRQRLWPGFLAELRALAVRTVALAGDARLVFVGRSPESVYDYLAGALAATAWSDRCALLSISLGDRGPETPAGLAALRAHLRALDLAPARIASAPRPIALVDLIWKGRTFGALSSLLAEWAREEGVDVAAVRRRLRWVGITVRTKNSPRTWRWFQQLEWTRDYPRSALRGISIDDWMWTFLGDAQHKTMVQNHAGRWGSDELREPPRDGDTLNALRNAYEIHAHARTPEERARFAAGLAARVEMREPWLRSLVVALRRGAG